MHFTGGPQLQNQFEDAMDADEIMDESTGVEQYWVRVFGFQTDELPEVIEKFFRIGKISNKVTSTEGNWIDLCYASEGAAERALKENGVFLIPDRTIVGVKRITENQTVFFTCFNFDQLHFMLI